MFKQIGSLSRAGFTLIEVLVTLILVSLLAAAVFPVVTQQIGAADAPKLASDLSSLRTGIELFNANVRIFPGDLDDLVNKPSTTTEESIATDEDDEYENKHRVRWDGPYADLSLTDDQAAYAVDPTDNVSNNLGTIVSKLTCVNSSAIVASAGIDCETSSNHFVSIQLDDLTTDEFAKLNDSVDPSEESETPTNQQATGKLRCFVSGTGCSPAYYLVAPYIAK